MTIDMNAERLEEIKGQYEWGVGQSLACRNLSDSDIEWLIEQAQQTIDTQIQFVELHRDWLNMRTENERYREALEFYAEERKYMYQSMSLSGHPKIIEDEGNTARQALAGVTNGQSKT
ncbi:hypothetical protein [Sporosarcina sp. ITBMC105]